MTKEEAYDSFYGKGAFNRLHTHDKSGIDWIISNYAQQQAIAFAIHYAKSAIQNGYVKPSAVENDRIEERYAHFIENQFIEQQNKNNG